MRNPFLKFLRRPWFHVIALVCVAAGFLQGSSFAAVPKAGYRFEPGDKIEVTVFGEKDLSRTYAVDAEGNIEMLMLGSVKVQGLTTAEIKTRLITELANGYLQDPQVNVQVGELRPIYVLGYVRLPGSYAYRYGSTAKAAIAMAGGLGQAETQRPTVADFLAADERYRLLKQERVSLLIRQARLEAQRDNRDTFSFQPDRSSGNEAAIADFIGQQTADLHRQRAILKQQIGLLQSQKPRLEEEVNALKQQLTLQDEKIKLAREQVDRYDKLATKGLTRSATQAELRLELARHESDRWRIISELSQRQVVAGEIDVKIQDVEAQAAKQIDAELQQVRDKLKDVEVSLPLAAEIRESRLLQSGGLTTAADMPYVIQISRVRNGSVVTVAGDDSTILQAGDIVEIKSSARSAEPNRIIPSLPAMPSSVPGSGPSSVPSRDGPSGKVGLNDRPPAADSLATVVIDPPTNSSGR